MAASSPVPPRDFDAVQHDLEAVLAMFKKTSDSELRLQLLQRMRELVAEADAFVLANMRTTAGPGIS